MNAPAAPPVVPLAPATGGAGQTRPSTTGRVLRIGWRIVRRFLPRSLRGRLMVLLVVVLLLGTAIQHARLALVAAVTGQDPAAIASTQAHDVAAKAATPECASSWTSGHEVPAARSVYAADGGNLWVAGPHLCSPSGRFTLGFQGNGDLVAYDRAGAGRQPLHPTAKDTAGGTWTLAWETFTAGIGQVGYATRVVFEADGNLVLYGQDGAIVRQTGTDGIATPASATLDEAGNLLITDATGEVRYTSAATRESDCWTPGLFACTNHHGGA